MAERKVTSTLYLDGAPADEELNPFAIRIGPAAQRATGRKTTAKRKGDKPRNLNVRVKPQAQISAPRQNAPERVLSAIGRVSPGAEQTLRTVDDELLGLRELYGAGVRGVADALGGDVYGEGDLQSDDATTLALAGALGPAFSAAGRLGGAALRRLPAGVRQGASDLAARARRYMTEARPLADADYVEGVFRDLPEEMGAFAVRPQGQRQIATTYREPGALPAPPRVLGLPAPGPGLPPFAAKPRGGQWWADSPYLDVNVSPEAAAREGAEALGFKTMRWEPEVPGDLRRYLNPKAVETSPEQQWLERALAKYYKTEFGAPTDPLRDLAERGLHYDPEMTPERWQQTVNDYLLEDPLQGIMFPSNPAGGMPGAGDDLRGQVMSTMPWLAKQPVTDNLYGISKGGLDLEHFTDEFYNALNPELSGLPADLAVRPESLGRMTFPQAVERVGRINQWRAKQQAEAMAGSYDNPAVRLFKEYPDDERGLRWVELTGSRKLSDHPAELPAGHTVAPTEGGYLSILNSEGREVAAYPAGTDPAVAYQRAQAQASADALEEALNSEGDTMGHCVGGYCPDVLRGNMRIFSLRDAQGMPHVTVETRPGDPTSAYQAELARMRETGLLGQWTDWLRQKAANPDYKPGMNGLETLNEWRATMGMEPLETSVPDRIKQIKGSGKKNPGQRLRLSSQNLGGNDDYLLPYVQDFVKSQQWSNVDDLHNTDLVKLPDGRYITQQQMEEVLSSVHPSYRLSPNEVSRIGTGDSWWDEVGPRFEGYAVGGRVDADRCFCHNPLSVKRKAR